MNFLIFALRRAFVRSRAAYSQDSGVAIYPGSGAVEHQPNISPTRSAPMPVAIWRVNAETGQLECHWTCDSDEIAAWCSRSWLERFGHVLAVGQRSHVSGWVH